MMSQRNHPGYALFILLSIILSISGRIPKANPNAQQMKHLQMQIEYLKGYMFTQSHLMFLVFLCISPKNNLFQDQDQPLAQKDGKNTINSMRREFKISFLPLQLCFPFIFLQRRRQKYYSKEISAAADGRSHPVLEI